MNLVWTISPPKTPEFWSVSFQNPKNLQMITSVHMRVPLSQGLPMYNLIEPHCFLLGTLYQGPDLL